MQSQNAAPDWGLTPQRASGSARHVQLVLVLALFAALAFVITYLLGPVLGLAAIIGITAGIALLAFWWATSQGRLALRAAKATRARLDDAPRLSNIASGLATDVGMRAPTLYVIDEPGANAFVCIARGPVLAVTRGLLEGYTRTELEAEVAHGLVRLAAGTLRQTALGIALGPLGTRSFPPVGTADDVEACALTRYPPALATAIEKADVRTGRFAPFWFVATGGGHRSPRLRIEAIKDL